MSERKSRTRGLRAALVGLAAASALPSALNAAEADMKAKMELGRRVFTQIAQPSCGLCHTLVDAGTKGEIGAKLDELRPDKEKVLQAVRQGSGVMPRYDDKLTKEQIEAVAEYVSRAVKLAK